MTTPEPDRYARRVPGRDDESDTLLAGDLLLILLSVGSLLVWEGIRRRWARGEPALEALPRNPSPNLQFATAAAAVFIGALALLHLVQLVHPAAPIPPEDHGNPLPVWASVRDGVLAIAVSWMVLTSLGRVPADECGLRWSDVGGQIRDGVLGFLASFGPVLLVLIASSPLRTEENQHPFLQLLRDNPSPETMLGLFVAAVLVAPIKEELLFRVMLQDWLSRRIGAARAIGIVAVLFSFVHGFPDSIALIPLAIVLGYLYERRQSILSVVVTHALFNLANLLITLWPHSEG